jgi:hypothetical protein
LPDKATIPTLSTKAGIAENVWSLVKPVDLLNSPLMKIQSYKTVTADSLTELDKKVNALIEQGFQPFGTPYCPVSLQGSEGCTICQTMVAANE